MTRSERRSGLSKKNARSQYAPDRIARWRSCVEPRSVGRDGLGIRRASTQLPPTRSVPRRRLQGFYSPLRLRLSPALGPFERRSVSIPRRHTSSRHTSVSTSDDFGGAAGVRLEDQPAPVPAVVLRVEWRTSGTTARIAARDDSPTADDTGHRDAGCGAQETTDASRRCGIWI